MLPFQTARLLYFAPWQAQPPCRVPLPATRQSRASSAMHGSLGGAAGALLRATRMVELDARWRSGYASGFTRRVSAARRKGQCHTDCQVCHACCCRDHGGGISSMSAAMLPRLHSTRSLSGLHSSPRREVPIWWFAPSILFCSRASSAH